MVTQIKKRNGQIVDFQKEKIRHVIGKAAAAVDPEIDPSLLDSVADFVLQALELKYDDTAIPDVESVQDIVEIALMKYDLYDVAKGYILYRAEHYKIREKRKQETLQKIARKKLYLTKRSGEKVLFDAEFLYRDFEMACKGYEDIADVGTLVERCEANMYDGMTVDELGSAKVLTARAYIEKDPAFSLITTRLALQNLYDEVFEGNESKNLTKDYRESFVKNIKSAVKSNRLVKDMASYDLQDLAKALKPERDSLFEYLGFQTLYDRYFLREEGGERKLETPQAFWMRVSMGIALNEGERKTERAKQFYEVISSMRYVPSTPTLFNSGTTYAQLSSCYLNTVEDDLTHIFKVYGDNAQLSKYSGGIGTDWTNLRGTGALIKKTNVGSQGVIPFLRIANDVTVAINRSGKRRGATCAYLEVWHFDYEDFLDLRKNTGDERRRTHDMNIASWIPDLFMKRMLTDGKWTLFSPDETPDLHHIYGQAFEKRYVEYEKMAEKGEIKLFKTLSAKQMWRKMVTMLFETGHPWMTWKDACNIRSPQDHVGVIHNSNLCTEITLNTSAEETAVCNLGSINYPRHMQDGKVNWELLQDTVQVAMRMLDNVIDVNYYPTAEAKTSNLRHRPVGLGIMGFQDALYLQDLSFESEAAVQFADESMEFISYHAILTSSMLAKERGAYASFKGSKWDRGIFPVDTLDLLAKERGMEIPVGRGAKMDWASVKAAVKKYGMRNSNTMASAPTATISNISGCYPCIEPIYKNLYVKSNMSGEFTVVNHYLVNDLKRLGLWNDDMLSELKKHDGSVQKVDTIPSKLKAKYKEVFELDALKLVKVTAYRGKWIDQSQSFNLFVSTTSGKYISDAYQYAWKMGLKTTYYLRTLGASSVEKSTVDVQNMETSTILKNTTAAEKPAEAVVETATTVSMSLLAKERDPEITVKACRYDDPNCEACQ